jgi:endoglucanase
VVGNQLLNGNNQPVHLHGVNYSGLEYACIQGWGIFDGPSDNAMVAAIASWHSNVVHLGLNEDCVLGINGVPPQYAGANYMNAIVAFVNRLHAHGLYAEISLMWAAPGNQRALGHPKILDLDHSPAAWQVIANTFRTDPNTFFGLQSEPHDIGWACWKNGGSSCSVGYAAFGMQSALNTIRATGATNVITVSGINWANDLSQWLTWRPVDPLNQLMAEAHIYGTNACSSNTCLNAQVAPVAAVVPVVFGETGETHDDSSCGSANINRIMTWADAHGVGYQAWVWNTWGTCGSLISDFDGTPANAFGTWVRNHYLQFPAP